MNLALVAVPGIGSEPGWSDGKVPEEHAIRGFHGVKLLLRESGPTAAILEDVLGFAEAGREGSIVRFKAGETKHGGIVDIHVAGDFLRGRQGGGSVTRCLGDRRRAGGVRRGSGRDCLRHDLHLQSIAGLARHHRSRPQPAAFRAHF